MERCRAAESVNLFWMASKILGPWYVYVNKDMMPGIQI
jgi:hypothetical protein